jgi:hypothetical protein
LAHLSGTTQFCNYQEYPIVFKTMYCRTQSLIQLWLQHLYCLSTNNHFPNLKQSKEGLYVYKHGTKDSIICTTAVANKDGWGCTPHGKLGKKQTRLECYNAYWATLLNGCSSKCSTKVLFTILMSVPRMFHVLVQTFMVQRLGPEIGSRDWLWKKETLYGLPYLQFTSQYYWFPLCDHTKQCYLPHWWATICCHLHFGTRLLHLCQLVLISLHSYTGVWSKW